MNCKAPGCERRPAVKEAQLCFKHYQWMRRYGSLDGPPQRPVSSKRAAWESDERMSWPGSYFGAEVRLSSPLVSF